jgi:hypothetical protein
MEEAIVGAFRLKRVHGSARGDRLHALSRSLTQNAERVRRKRFPLLFALQVGAHACKERIKSRLPCRIHLVRHVVRILDTLIEHVNTTHEFVADKVGNKRHAPTRNFSVLTGPLYIPQ